MLRPLTISQENLDRLRDMHEHASFWFHDVVKAYIAHQRVYRPEAPSDGGGHPLLDDNQLADPIRLEIEAHVAARKFYDQDQDAEFTLHGCTHGEYGATMYLALQAAQLCCGGVERLHAIHTMLRMAIEALPPDRPSSAASEETAK
jgi:hypothetical protein